MTCRNLSTATLRQMFWCETLAKPLIQYRTQNFYPNLRHMAYTDQFSTGLQTFLLSVNEGSCRGRIISWSGCGIRSAIGNCIGSIIVSLSVKRHARMRSITNKTICWRLFTLPTYQKLLEAHWWSLNGRNLLVWPRKYAHSSFSSLVQSLLPKDTLLRTYLTSQQLVTGTVWRR